MWTSLVHRFLGLTVVAQRMEAVNRLIHRARRQSACQDAGWLLLLGTPCGVVSHVQVLSSEAFPVQWSLFSCQCLTAKLEWRPSFSASRPALSYPHLAVEATRRLWKRQGMNGDEEDQKELLDQSICDCSSQITQAGMNVRFGVSGGRSEQLASSITSGEPVGGGILRSA